MLILYNIYCRLLGIPIAFFSGLGVALSVIDEQTSSLVGVAISASLLPPAGKIIISCVYNFLDSSFSNYKLSPLVLYTV